MELLQELANPINGYWDGGPKKTFTWYIDGSVQHDAKGPFIRIGSYEANHWFYVAVGETIKQTLGNAQRRLAALARRAGVACKFSYIN